ncbi:MAG: hypothetical protein HY611_01210 [Elusimicrobia bacterium]|nr:hypothetical protein [Elusimicrobiota bacterium]
MSSAFRHPGDMAGACGLLWVGVGELGGGGMGADAAEGRDVKFQNQALKTAFY